MDRTVVGLFNDLPTARLAVEDLVSNGFLRDNISLVASDASGNYARFLRAPDAPVSAADSETVTTGEGAGFGAVVGAIIGALATVGALTIPGIGPVIAAGPLAATLGALGGAAVGAGAGAVTGGVTAALVNSGIPPEAADFYAEGIRQGHTLVTLHTDDVRYLDAENVLNRHMPIDVNQKATEWPSAH